MSFLEQITKATPQAPVITIVGYPGSGKSSLGAHFPAPLFIQAESASTVFETWPEEKQPALLPIVKSSSELLDQLREIISTQHDYKTVVIDSITTLNATLEAEIMKADDSSNIGEAAGGFGKGYLAVAALHAKIRNACEYLRRKGIAVVFLAHSGIVKVKNRPDVEAYSTWSIDMHEASRRIYVATSDAVLYLKSREFVTGHQENRKGQVTKLGKMTNTGERVLITSSDGTIGYVDAKNRYRIPDEIEVPEGTNPILQYIPFFK